MANRSVESKARMIRALIAVTLAWSVTVVLFQNCAQSFAPKTLASSASSGAPLGLAGGTPTSTPGGTPSPTPGGAPTGDYAPSAGPALATALRTVSVSNVSAFLNALDNALPGDAIVLEDGTYRFSGNKVLTRAGTAANRIFVTSRNFGGAVIEHCNIEGFNVAQPYWVFDRVKIRGVCPGGGSENSHAFHVVGQGSNLIVRNSEIIDFQSHVKLNSFVVSGVQTWPDEAWFINNIWRDTRPMPGNGPHNVLNLDGGNRHVIRGNAFVDLAIAQDINAQSAIYPKAGIQDALIEQNLIVCNKRVTSGNTVRAINTGEAWGSGGICNGDCANQRAVFRNNIVLHCQGSGNSTGVSVNYEANMFFGHNLIHDVPRNWYSSDSPGPNAFIGNLMHKPWVFAGADRPTESLSLTPDAGGMNAIYINPDLADFALKDGTSIRGKAPRQDKAPHDFCGNLRAATTDIGPIDYDHPNAGACVNYIKTLYNSL